MKKRLAIIALCLLFAVSAFAKAGIEIRGGAALLSPETFNTAFHSSMQSVFPRVALVAASYPDQFDTATMAKIEAGLNIDASLKFFASDAFAIVLRSQFTTSEAENLFQINDVDAFKAHAAFETVYAGAGFRFYVPDTGAFKFYLGADGGAFFNINSFWEIWANRDNEYVIDLDPVGGSNPGTDLAYGLVSSGTYFNQVELQQLNFTDMFFGGNIEAGIDLALADSFSIVLAGGYRIGNLAISTDTTGSFVDADGNTVTSLDVTEANLSGPYFLGGISINFGDEAKAKQAGGGGGAAASGTISKYEKYGNYYYKKRNYSYALRYFLGALKLAPNAQLYKKIGFCYYYLKQKQKAMYYLDKYLEMNPNDMKIKKWLRR